MNDVLIRDMHRCVHNIRVYFTLLSFSESFLEELRNSGVISEEQFYRIFASPLPTVYRKSSRIITFFQIAGLENDYRNFFRFFRNLELRKTFEFELENRIIFKNRLEVELLSFPRITEYLNNLRIRQSGN